MGFLSRIYRNLIPNGILARFALIICAPIIICEIITIYIFYDKVWFSVSGHISKMITSQIQVVLMEYKEGDLTSLVKYSRLFNIRMEEVPILPKKSNRELRTELKILSYSLQDSIDNFKFIDQDYQHSMINIYFDTQYIPSNLKSNENNNIYHMAKLAKSSNDDKSKSYIKISIPTKPLLNQATEIFIFWILGTSSFFLLIALAFAKNQIRSIEELSIAANAFGSNLTSNEAPIITFKPSGAAEIRRAGIAFIKMQDRLRRQMQNRLQMLASISHDLRTPLTRMILQIELMEECKEIDLLRNDTTIMKHMIDSYLDFARGESSERFITTELNKYLREFFTISRFKITTLILDKEPVYARIRHLSFMRALDNIIANAEKYTTYAELRCIKKEEKIIISLEDNGPGISDEEKNLVFKAFYRSGKARPIGKQGSVGLGLPIAKEIILSHKGDIYIEDSKNLGGAKIVISLEQVKQSEVIENEEKQ